MIDNLLLKIIISYFIELFVWQLLVNIYTLKFKEKYYITVKSFITYFHILL